MIVLLVNFRLPVGEKENIVVCIAIYVWVGTTESFI
jgi:hypothetical protein